MSFVDRKNLLTAAVAGIMAGGLAVGCDGGGGYSQTASSVDDAGATNANDAAANGATDADSANNRAWEMDLPVHACATLNKCANEGGCAVAEGENQSDCAGQNTCEGKGGCATVEHHGCAGENECAGQGGCEVNTDENQHACAGENECSGQGGCAIPYHG